MDARPRTLRFLAVALASIAFVGGAALLVGPQHAGGPVAIGDDLSAAATAGGSAAGGSIPGSATGPGPGGATTGPGESAGSSAGGLGTAGPIVTLGPSFEPVATDAPDPTALPTTAPTPGPTLKPTPAPTAKPTATPKPPSLSACPVFPASNVWNKRVDTLPVAANSSAMISSIGVGSALHPDFSNNGGYGIPFNIVGAATPRSTVTFDYDDESDHVGYPIPSNPKIEGGSDAHILMIDTDACRLFELYAASGSGTDWTAGSGATWDLRSNALRPATWTSADAAGLPIFPGLVRYDEVAKGVIAHAIRFTASQTCNGYIYPARHEAGSGSCSTRPPMGLRVRLRASVDPSGFGSQARIVLVALQRYGMILADNGSPWYITGAPSTGWDDDVLHALGGIHGSDFEVVDTSHLVNG